MPQPEDREPAQSDWLTDAVGFVVEAGAQRIGRAVDVQRDDSGRAIALVVRSGLGGRRRILVPVHDVAGVVLSGDRIVVDGARVPSEVTRTSFAGASPRPLSPVESTG